MDIKEIQELIRFVAKSGVNEVELERDGFKLSIKANAPAPVAQVVAAPMPVQVAAPAPVAAAAPAPAAVAAPAASNETNYLTITSPMIGTFYRTPGPDKDAFVNVGDLVEPGKVVCIVEAMKLFNEIESEVKGRIVKVLVDNASPVEYGQPLFLVDPA
ncbi:MAG: Biotin carboxyl carrier protein of acetyl-CoA carboxylase [Bacteroidota bacterium]|jgi:acetyl-CoA carboxylase biotin carboxyl carrier protein